MVKTKFSQLGKGSDDLLSGLDILNKSSKPESFNPLKVKDQKKSKKPAVKPSKIKPSLVEEKLKTTQRVENEPVAKKQNQFKASQPKQNRPAAKESWAGQGRGQKIPANKTQAPQQVISESMPEDFRSHSILVSAGQLDQLRQKVYLVKASGNRKYSIKDAFYQAFSMYLDRREEKTEFPDDFITYTPSLSMSMWEEMNSAMYSIKAMENPKYAMKYAIYEAIEMFLRT